MKTKKILSKIILTVLIAAMVLSFAACGSDNKDQGSDNAAEKSFTFEVSYLDGTGDSFSITTTRQYVGEALLDEGLIEGEQGDYGLYVKVVNGVTADYDVDGHYWAFYVDGEYASTGVDTTEIVDGAVYSFKVE